MLHQYWLLSILFKFKLILLEVLFKVIVLKSSVFTKDLRRRKCLLAAVCSAAPILVSLAFIYDVTTRAQRYLRFFQTLFLQVVVQKKLVGKRKEKIRRKKRLRGQFQFQIASVLLRFFHLYWQFSQKWQKINWLLFSS